MRISLLAFLLLCGLLLGGCAVKNSLTPAIKAADNLQAMVGKSVSTTDASRVPEFGVVSYFALDSDFKGADLIWESQYGTIMRITFKDGSAIKLYTSYAQNGDEILDRVVVVPVNRAILSKKWLLAGTAILILAFMGSALLVQRKTSARRGGVA